MSKETGGGPEKPGKTSNVIRKTFNMQPTVVRTSEQLARKLDQNLTDHNNHAHDLYNVLGGTIADGGRVEIKIWEPGESEPTHVMPTEFARLRRKISQEKSDNTPDSRPPSN